MSYPQAGAGAVYKRSGLLGWALGQLRARDSAVPGDELTDYPCPIPRADERTEGIPQLIADPDRSMRCVGRRLHAAHRNPWISARRGIGVVLDIQ